jgi:hypothetical protein
MLKVEFWNDGWWVYDRYTETDGIAVHDQAFYTREEAEDYLEVLLSETAHDKRVADRIDGYDRDDLGYSPDY